jgi:hypothetical protein
MYVAAQRLGYTEQEVAVHLGKGDTKLVSGVLADINLRIARGHGIKGFIDAYASAARRYCKPPVSVSGAVAATLVS